MTSRALLLGRTPFDPDAVHRDFGRPGLHIETGTSLADVQEAWGAGAPEVVIMGAGLPIEDRLEIIEWIYAHSETTSVHLKDRSSGKDGMTAFVQGILATLVEP